MPAFKSTYKPEFGNAELLKTHPLFSNLKLALIFNEGGGNTVWDMVTKKPYSFSTVKPAWHAEGLFSNAISQYVVGPRLNEILQQNSNGTVIWGYRWITEKTTACYFCVGNNYSTFSIQLNSTDLYVNMANAYFRKSNSASFFASGNSCAWSWGNGASAPAHKIYRNGELMITGTTSAAFPNSSATLNIGCNPGQTGMYAGGPLKYIYFFNRQLNNTEVLSFSNNPYQILCNKYERNKKSNYDSELYVLKKFISDSGTGSDSDDLSTVLSLTDTGTNIDSIISSTASFNFLNSFTGFTREKSETSYLRERLQSEFTREQINEGFSDIL